MIVDDSGLTRKIIRQMLHTIGFQNVDEAAEGREALVYLNKITYSLVISDWNMSPMSGMELLTSIRASQRTKELPFIMATARSQKKFASVARENGATHYLEKPFTPQQLTERIGMVWPQHVPLQR